MEELKQFLYHGTSFEGLLWIIRSDQMTVMECDGPTGVSLTSSFEFALKFGRGRSAERAKDVEYNLRNGWEISDFCPSESLQWTLFKEGGGEGCCITFDRVKLEQYFNLCPYDAFGDSRESELRLLGEKICGVVKCIDKIVIENHSYFARYAHELLVADVKFSDSIRAIINLVDDPSDDLVQIAKKNRNCRP